MGDARYMCSYCEDPHGEGSDCPSQKFDLIQRILPALNDWANELTVGELKDLIEGNHGAYSGMPDIARYVEPVSEAGDA